MFKEFEHSLQNDITIEFSIVDITMHNEESSREFAYSVSIQLDDIITTSIALIN